MTNQRPCFSKVNIINTITYALVFGSSLDTFFTFENGLFVVSPFRLLLIPLVLISLFRLYSERKATVLVCTLIFFIVYGGFSLIYSPLPVSGLRDIISFAMLALSVDTAIRYLDKSQYGQKILFSVFVAGQVVLVLISPLFSNSFSYGKRLIFESIGINTLSISAGMSIGIIIWLVSNCYTKLGFILPLFSLIPITVFVALSGTRSVLVANVVALLVASLSMIPVTWRRTSRIRHKTLVTIASLMALVIASLFILPKLVDQLILSRFTFSIAQLNDIFFSQTDRGELASTAIRTIMSHPFGLGAGSETAVFSSTYSLESHNSFLSVGIDYGLPGLVISILSFIYLFYRVINVRPVSYRFLAMYLFLYLFLNALKGTFFYTRFFWIPMLLILYLLEISQSIRASSRINSSV